MKIKNLYLMIIMTLNAAMPIESSFHNSLLKNLTTTAAITAIGIAAYAGYSQYTQAQPAIPSASMSGQTFGEKEPDSNNPDLSDKKLEFQSSKNNAQFLWGIGTAEAQIIENGNNHGWSQEYIDRYVSYEDKNKENAKYAPTSHGCLSWNNWEDDIEKVKTLGCTAYRFSVEWSRVQPTKNGGFDKKAIDHYVAIAQKLQEEGIDPMVCLHHYSDPIWFLEEGGFSKEENVVQFKEFCMKMHEALNPHVEKWIISSQPVSYAIKGYKTAMAPPFLKGSGKDSDVAFNLLKAHTEIYDAMHQAYEEATNKNDIKEPFIGICHQTVQMKPFYALDPVSKLIAFIGSRMYNDSFFNFFKAGKFQWLSPISSKTVEDAQSKFDFFALSYYCPSYFYGPAKVEPKVAPQLETDDEMRIIHAQGMYDAIKEAALLGKPVYVVENGIDTKDEEKRKFFFNSYLSAIAKAIQDGCDVRGYFHWTLMDNYEWGKKDGSTHYGLFKNRSDEKGELKSGYNKHEKMLKESGHHYKQIIKRQTSDPKK